MKRRRAPHPPHTKKLIGFANPSLEHGSMVIMDNVMLKVDYKYYVAQ